MTLRLIGAGLGRTGTTSLEIALEKLLVRRRLRSHGRAATMSEPVNVESLEWLREASPDGAAPGGARRRSRFAASFR